MPSKIDYYRAEMELDRMLSQLEFNSRLRRPTTSERAVHDALQRIRDVLDGKVVGEYVE